MARVAKVISEEIADSRGIPTLRTTVFLDDGSQGVACVPSGASVGAHEAVELRDGDFSRYNGKGVLKAIGNVQGPIFNVLKGIDATGQQRIDDVMRDLDGTENKSCLGANAILSVSLAVAVAASASQKTPLYKYLRELIDISKDNDIRMPAPMVNLINGGKHVNRGLEFQEFLIVPKVQPSFKERFEAVLKITRSLKQLIEEGKLNASFGDEGGFALSLTTNEEAIKLLKEAIKKAGFTEDTFGVGLDVAANTIYKDGFYHFRDAQKPLKPGEFVDFLVNLSEKHSLFSIEDPLSEEDWGNWKNLTKRLRPRTDVIADDLTTTNIKRLERLIANGSANGVLVKPNQIGTLTETCDFIKIAKGGGLKIVVSHRSGETKDSFIADLAVAAGADFIKVGSPSQKERLIKYQRLLEIEKSLVGEGA